MKNLVIYSGIALVVIANGFNTLFESKNEVEASQKEKQEIVLGKGSKIVVSNEFISNSKKGKTLEEPTAIQSKTLFLRNFSKIKDIYFVENYELIGEVSIKKVDKTSDELIAEDNEITENTISNETQALNFNVINSISEDYEIIESVNISKRDKTSDELIADDNEITENTISNETQALDFNVINSISEAYEAVEPINIPK